MYYKALISVNDNSIYLIAVPLTEDLDKPISPDIDLMIPEYPKNDERLIYHSIKRDLNNRLEVSRYLNKSYGSLNVVIYKTIGELLQNHPEVII